MNIRRMTRMAAGAALVPTAVALAFPAQAFADTGPPAAVSSRAPALTSTMDFKYTGKPQVFIPPAGITKLHVIAGGASGGHGGKYNDNLGGREANGQKIDTTIDVAPGMPLYVMVGGVGEVGTEYDTTDSHGGWNGGGDGARRNGSTGGGGGGASDIRFDPQLLETRLAVAAGGGGGGGAGSGEPGGNGGVGGASGSDAGHDSLSTYGRGGSAGTTDGGGKGGYAPVAANGDSGDRGRGGDGGKGFLQSHGGGGGGGYFGGGGGGGSILNGGGGGAGGSSWSNPSEGTTTTITTSTSYSGFVQIQWSGQDGPQVDFFKTKGLTYTEGGGLTDLPWARLTKATNPKVTLEGDVPPGLELKMVKVGDAGWMIYASDHHPRGGYYPNCTLHAEDGNRATDIPFSVVIEH